MPYQTMAIATTATIGSANRFTRSQPAAVTVMPDVNEEIAIMMKLACSLAPWALAISSGRQLIVRYPDGTACTATQALDGLWLTS